MNLHHRSSKTRLKHIVITALLSTLLTFLVVTSSFANKSYGPVKANDYLSKIVNKSYPNSNLNQNQIMVAILRANPEAFRGGNVHFLRQNVTLSLPNETDIATISPTEAVAVIAEHLKFFKRGQPGKFVNKPLIISTESKDNNEQATEKPDQVTETSANSVSPKIKIEIRKEQQEKDNKVKQLGSLEKLSDQQSKTLNSLDEQIHILEEQLRLDAEKEKATLQTASTESPTTTKEPAVTTEMIKETTKPIIPEETAPQPPAEPETEEEPSAESVTAATDDDNQTDTFAENAISSLESRLAETSSEKPLTIAATKKEPPAVAADTSTIETSKTSMGEVSPLTESPSKSSSSKFFSKPLLTLFAALALGLFLLSYFLLNRSAKQETVATTEALRSPQKDDTATTNLEISDQENLLNPVIETHNKLIVTDESRDQLNEHQAQDAEIKINMARAYMDMGYIDASKDILLEVVNEGKQEQKDTAQQMLDML